MIDDEGNFHVTLPAGLRSGSRVVVMLPEGNWHPPTGWTIEGRTMHTTWSPGKPTQVVVHPVEIGPLPRCGLCNRPIFPTDPAIDGGDLPDAHVVCYAKAVEVKVSAPGGPADPYPPAGPDLTPWAPGVAYAVNDEVTFNDLAYRCRQAHTSQTGWEPPNVPALWLAV